MAAVVQFHHGKQAVNPVELASMEMSAAGRSLRSPEGEHELYVTARTIDFCNRLGKLWVWRSPENEVEGFLAWLRVSRLGFVEVKKRSFSLELKLDAIEQQFHGPYLIITEMVKPPHLNGFQAVRALVKQEKPKWLAAWVNDEFRLRKVTR